jgi:hypothetical protein
MKYIEGNCDFDTINRLYLECGWRIASIHTDGSRNNIGAYVLLEKEEEEEVKAIEIEAVLNNIGITMYNSDGTLRARNEVM